MKLNAIKPIENENLTTELAALEGVYECPCCNGTFMVDATFIEQVGNSITCMYCQKPLLVTDCVIGDRVVVNEEWGGTIIDFKLDGENVLVCVEDMEENVFDVELDSIVVE